MCEKNTQTNECKIIYSDGLVLKLHKDLAGWTCGGHKRVKVSKPSIGYTIIAVEQDARPVNAMKDEDHDQ